MNIQPTHALYFYLDEEGSRYDFECAMNGKNMRMFISELRSQIRNKIKYEEKAEYEEFRDMVNALLEEYELLGLE